MRKIVVAASSMPAGRNMSSQVEFVTRIRNYGADIYHLDVIDGVFAKHKTIDYQYIEQLREKAPLIFDVHLMVDKPQKTLKKYLNAEVDIVTVQYEVFQEAEELIKVLKQIKKAGKMVGLCIDLPTKIEVIDQFIKYLDVVLIMSVKAGKGGQKFDEKALKKIKYVRSLSQSILIEVDGGIDNKTGAQCIRAGADILVAGTYIYNNDSYDAIKALKGKNG